MKALVVLASSTIPFHCSEDNSPLVIPMKLIPYNRIGQPEDLAQSCYFLCTSDASWITGHTLIVDGGTTFR